eukprot:207614_1
MSTDYVAIEYIHLANVDFNIEYINSVTDDTNKSFKWVDIFVTYYPMWSRKLHRKQMRSKWVNNIMIVLILFTLTCTFLFFSNHLFQSHIKSAKGSTVIAHICQELSFLFAFSSRLCSIYYFYYKFNYPWNYSQLKVMETPELRKYFTFIFIFIFGQMFSNIIIAISTYFNHDPIYFVARTVGTIFLWIPSNLAICVSAATFVYYYSVVKQLAHDLEQRNASYTNIFDEYKQVITLFKSDYHYSLQWSIILRFSEIALLMWVLSYDLLHFAEETPIDYALISIVIPGFLVFVVCASLMNYQCSKFECILFERGELYMNNNSDCSDMMRYNYLLQFVSNNPLQVSFGKFKVTNTNFITFCAGFVVAKVFAYSVVFLFDN